MNGLIFLHQIFRGCLSHGGLSWGEMAGPGQGPNQSQNRKGCKAAPLQTVRVLGVSFYLGVNYHYINKSAKRNFPDFFTLGTRRAQSWQKLRNFLIFAFFDLLWIFVLRATF